MMTEKLKQAAGIVKNQKAEGEALKQAMELERCAMADKIETSQRHVEDTLEQV